MDTDSLGQPLAIHLYLTRQERHRMPSDFLDNHTHPPSAPTTIVLSQLPPDHRALPLVVASWIPDAQYQPRLADRLRRVKDSRLTQPLARRLLRQ